MEHQEPSRWKRIVLFLLQPKVGIPLIFFVTLLISPWVYRGYMLSQLPNTGHPFDINAFGTVEIADDENAYVEYKLAAASLVDYAGPNDEEFYKIRESIFENGWDVADEDFINWLTDNLAALQTWRQGTEKPNGVYIQPKDLTFDTLIPLVSELRDLAILARLEGLRLESENDLAEAWDWYRAMFRSSRHNGLHGCLIERLVGIAIHIIAVEAMTNWAANPDVDTELLRQAINDVTTDYKMTAISSLTWKMEHLMLMNSLSQPNAIELLSDSAGSYSGLGKIGLYFMGEPEFFLGVVKYYYENQLSQIDKPRHMRTARRLGDFELFELDAKAKSNPKNLSPTHIELLIEKSAVAASSLPAIPQYDIAVGREEARQAALVMLLAVQLFYREHGEFPEKAEQLIGDVLQELPADPWGKAGKTIIYRRDEQGAVIWSIGPNETDDKGDIDRDDVEEGDIGFRVKIPKKL